MEEKRATDWQSIANCLEFAHPQEMLQYWYINQGKSLQQISDIIEVNISDIKNKLLEYRIIQRKKETGRRLGYFICRYCKIRKYGDIRNICCDNPECVEKHKLWEKQEKYRSFNKQRSRKKDNICKICGRDKGKNHFYCKHCHSILSNGLMFDGV